MGCDMDGGPGGRMTDRGQIDAGWPSETSVHASYHVKTGKNGKELRADHRKGRVADNCILTRRVCVVECFECALLRASDNAKGQVYNCASLELLQRTRPTQDPRTQWDTTYAIGCDGGIFPAGIGPCRALRTSQADSDNHTSEEKPYANPPKCNGVRCQKGSIAYSGDVSEGRT